MTAKRRSPAQLATLLAPAEQWLVVVDFDGTLSPIVHEPGAARPVAGAVTALRVLAERTAVAVVSGRPVDDLRHRLQPDLPVTWAGGHGAEILAADGTTHRLVDPQSVAGTIERVRAELLELIDPGDGWEVEVKDASLAVHHRNVTGSAARLLLPAVRATLESCRNDPPGFEVLAGKAVLELRPRGADKGSALAWIADRTPLLQPLAVGDDVTDEDAFSEANARGGAAILVADEPRASEASWRVGDPAEVVAFLVALSNGPSAASGGSEGVMGRGTPDPR